MTVSDDEIRVMLDEELAARRAKAMFLRNAGATIQKIAEETGVSCGTVRKDLAIVRRDINNEKPEDVIARHRAVVFDIQRANYPAMMRGDEKAATVILRALEREARLLGLDAPTRVLASVSDVEFANEAARLIERIAALDPPTLKELERVRGSEARIVIDAELAEANTRPGRRDDRRPAGDRQRPQLVDGQALDAEADDAEARPGEPDHAARRAAAAGGLSDEDWSNI